MYNPQNFWTKILASQGCCMHDWCKVLRHVRISFETECFVTLFTGITSKTTCWGIQNRSKRIKNITMRIRIQSHTLSMRNLVMHTLISRRPVRRKRESRSNVCSESFVNHHYHYSRSNLYTALQRTSLFLIDASLTSSGRNRDLFNQIVPIRKRRATSPHLPTFLT